MAEVRRSNMWETVRARLQSVCASRARKKHEGAACQSSEYNLL